MSVKQPDFELPLTTYSRNGQNGRVNIDSKSSAGGSAPSEFPGYKYQTTSEQNFETDMLRGNWETTPVSKIFFSAENMRLIQNGIRRDVYNKSQPKGYLIDKQSVEELKIIMRAIYLQYARNLPKDFPGQIDDLNTKVIDWSVPHILSAVDHYVYYIQDISHLPVPLAQPPNLSRAGTRSLPQNPFM